MIQEILEAALLASLPTFLEGVLGPALAEATSSPSLTVRAEWKRVTSDGRKVLVVDLRVLRFGSTRHIASIAMGDDEVDLDRLFERVASAAGSSRFRVRR